MNGKNSDTTDTAAETLRIVEETSNNASQVNGRSADGSCLAAPSEKDNDAYLPVSTTQDPPSLAEVLTGEEGPLLHKRALEMIVSCCEQLTARKVPHGSLSPSAILFMDALNNEPILIDPLVCLAPYKAPEARHSHASTARADIYSLGVILYELLSNKMNSAAQREDCYDDLPSKLAFSPAWTHVPTNLKKIIRKCLQEDPKLRYSKATELRDDILDYLRPARIANRQSTFTKVVATLALLVAWAAYLIAPSLAPTSPPAPPVVSSYADSIANQSKAQEQLNSSTLNNLTVPINNVPLDNTETALLAKHEVDLLIDKSSSMAGQNWAWTAQQVYTFANQTSACLPVGFSTITFDSNIERFDNCDTRKLIDIYKNNQPSGGTILAPAIESALKKRTTKPLAIVVITDGQPSDRSEVERTIVDAASKLSTKDQLRIVFLTIGDYAPPWLDHLDNSLMQSGAPYDVVTTLPFAEVCRLGLSHAITSAVADKPQPTK